MVKKFRNEVNVGLGTCIVKKYIVSTVSGLALHKWMSEDHGN